jgi:hypothetical protein
MITQEQKDKYPVGTFVTVTNNPNNPDFNGQVNGYDDEQDYFLVKDIAGNVFPCDYTQLDYFFDL